VHTAGELIDCIVNSSQIPSGKRREIQRELRSHIEDFVVAAREAGRDQQEIEKLVLVSFGDPGQIARGFAWVYRHERRRLRILTYLLSTVLLGSLLLAAILATQAGLAFGFGTPVTKVLASRHTMIEAFDILASVAVYLGVTSLESLFEKRPFQKAAIMVTLIVTMLIVSFAAAGLHTTFFFYGLVNGVFFRAIQLFVTPKAARIGIVSVLFPLYGFISALMWSPILSFDPVATCASWLAVGAGYLLMTGLAARVDTALLNGLQRFQAGF
jgi:hypothetical protein